MLLRIRIRFSPPQHAVCFPEASSEHQGASYHGGIAVVDHFAPIASGNCSRDDACCSAGVSFLCTDHFLASKSTLHTVEASPHSSSAKVCPHGTRRAAHPWYLVYLHKVRFLIHAGHVHYSQNMYGAPEVAEKVGPIMLWKVQHP